MSAFRLINAMVTARYDETDDKYYLDDKVSGHDTLLDALIDASGESDPDQLKIEATVRYGDPDEGSQWQITHFLYNTADDSLSLDSVIKSSSGTGEVAWNDLGDEVFNLVIYGTEARTSNLLILKDWAPITDGANWNQSSTTYAGYYFAQFQRSVKAGSKLKLDVHVNSRIQGQNGADNVRGRVQLQYKNTSGVWTVAPDSNSGAIIGHDNVAPFSPTTTMFQNVNLRTELDQTRLDDTGEEWDVRVALRVDYANNTIQTFSCSFYGQEIMRY
jgi:hypothetical protein